jgi:hypothetical protein
MRMKRMHSNAVSATQVAPSNCVIGERVKNRARHADDCLRGWGFPERPTAGAKTRDEPLPHEELHGVQLICPWRQVEEDNPIFLEEPIFK